MKIILTKCPGLPEIEVEIRDAAFINKQIKRRKEDIKHE